MHKRFGVAALLLAALAVALSSPGMGAQKKAAGDPWSVLRGYGLGSVAWSPKGDRIAFVAARWKDVSEFGLMRNSIWLMSWSTSGQSVEFKRLVTLTRKGNGEGIAAVLFWLDNDRIGWATQDGLRYTFMQMGLHDRKPRRLVNRSFSGIAVSDAPGGSAPGDVYYDAGSRTLLFSGSLTPIGVYVRVLPLSSKRIRDLSVPHPKGLVYPHAYLDAVTLCGSLRNPRKPVLYLAAWDMEEGYEQGGCRLWRSDSFALRRDKIIASFPHRGLHWPRTSPDGKLLACSLEGQVAVCDLQSGRHKVLTKRTSDSPAGGWCPFSWSPDGKRIAYADGARIKIIPVGAVR